MKKGIAFLLCVFLLAGCVPRTAQQSVTWLDLFDTVTTVTCFTEDADAFGEETRALREMLLQYHRLFDIYKTYDGLNNLKTVNEAAGKSPVAVNEAIIALLKDGVYFYELTGGRVNVAMGSVLSLWHEARETGVLPSEQALSEAARHTDITKLVINEENGTVFLTDPAMRLDVGAIAKGWAAQKVAQTLPDGYLLSVGGNVCATGPKQADTPWVVGVQDPDGGENYLQTLALEQGSAVTSGDYQRYVEIDGEKYHHIIDPDTLYPSELWRSVTVVCDDSALADALSTALFVLPLERGKELLWKTAAEAMWVAADGTCQYSDGFQQHLHAKTK